MKHPESVGKAAMDLPHPVSLPVGCAWELEVKDDMNDDMVKTGTTAHGAIEDEDELLQMVQDFAAEQVARMEVTRPEVLRSVPAHVAFHNFAEALRGKNKQSWYQRSAVCDRIGAFWSHSWHGECWKKIVTLFVLYNSLPAIVAGMVTAVLMALLFSLDCLPGLERVPGVDIQFCFWSLPAGSMISMLTFLLWRPQQRVFFDRICLHQSDSDLKTAGILSLAGILKHSDTMLVLWDATYSERLWCLFELAAFLKSKDIGPNVLIIKPTFTGPTAVFIFIGAVFGLLPLTLAPVDQFFLLPAFGIIFLMGAGQYLACASMRSYFQSVEDMSKSLKHLRIENTKCTCCNMGHVDEEGTPLIRDRKVVQECIRLWFGDQRGFEASIQTEVVEVLVRQLRQLAFPYKWRVGISTPILWACLDLVATFCKIAAYDLALHWLILGVLMWLICGPIIIQWAVFLTRAFYEKRPCLWQDVLKNIFVILIGMPGPMVLIAGVLFLEFAIVDPLSRSAIFVISVLFSACVMCCLQPQKFSLQSKVSPHPIEAHGNP